MFSKNINFKNFHFRNSYKKVKKELKNLHLQSSPTKDILCSLGENYKYNFSKQKYFRSKKKKFRVIGMGGSSLGSKAIYDFLKVKINKTFDFVDNVYSFSGDNKKNNMTNLIISKSGNTLETIVNQNIFIKKKDSNIIITEKNNNFLRSIASKLKAEIINHNNFIGGRYSVLSEVGMLPATLMGLDEKKFKQYNNLIKKKNFIDTLCQNVSNIFYLINKGYTNSVLLNYDKKSSSFLHWYQQLVAESLSKKSRGIIPIISEMPKDNHSLMQSYLDGPKKSFFTFFFVNEKKSNVVKDSSLPRSYSRLRNLDTNQIIYSQKKASQNVFKKKNLPYRVFDINERNEKTLGELFCFFILETILLGKMMKLNPFNQPSVELIKKETNKILF